MDGLLEKIKSRIDIVEYIGQTVTLKKLGRNYKGLCPFHQEKSPSFIVSQDRQIWHCFGACGDGGDVIKFVMKAENLSFPDAVRELAQKLGLRIDEIKQQDSSWSLKEEILKINALAAEYYQYILHKTAVGEKARDYLASRNLTAGIMEKFQLGYAPQSWDSLIKFLQKKRIPQEVLIQSGLLVKNDSSRVYDRFRGRIMFPIKDIRGNVIGFSGRVLDKEVKEAKYINTPESPVYHKRESLYGIHITKEAIKKADNAILVEGEFDVISSYQHEVENVVGVKGTAVTQEQLNLLKRLTTKITLALDSDNAGIEAIQRGIVEADKQEFEIYVMDIAEGKDPDEAVRKNPNSYKKAAASPTPVYDFLIQLYIEKYNIEDPFNKKRITEELVPLLAHIRNPIIQSHYVKKISELLSISESSLVTMIMREKKKKKVFYLPPDAKLQQLNKIKREDLLQNYILSYLFQSNEAPQLYEQFFKVLSLDDFSLPSHKKLLMIFAEQFSQQSHAYDPVVFAKTLPAELQAVFDQLYLLNIEDVQFAGENIERLLLEIKKNSLKRQISASLRNTEGNLHVASLTAELKQVEKSISSL